MTKHPVRNRRGKSTYELEGRSIYQGWSCYQLRPQGGWCAGQKMLLSSEQLKSSNSRSPSSEDFWLLTSGSSAGQASKLRKSPISFHLSQRLPESPGCQVGLNHLRKHSHSHLTPASMSSHHLLLASLLAVTIISTSNGFDLCSEPNIPNGGTVNSKKSENFFLGEVIFKQYPCI